MITEKYETIMKPQNTVVENTCTCDVCKRKIWRKEFLSRKTNFSNEVHYYEITTGHSDWGNDSVESIEHYQVCPKCLDSFVSQYFKEAKGTEYMEINRKWLYSDDSEEEN